MLNPENAVMWAMLVCIVTAVIMPLFNRSKRVSGWLAFAAAAISACLVFVAAVYVLMNGGGEPISFLKSRALGFALRLHVDGLSAVFLLLTAFVSICSAFYSIEYLGHYERHGPARYYSWLLLFIAALYGIVSTTDTMYFFFIFWQLMTVAGFALMRYENEKRANRRAAAKFFWMMQLACFVTMVGAFLLAPSGIVVEQGEELMRFDFVSLQSNMPALFSESPGVITAAFVLFLIGFGIKMGMWPLGGIWLPDAHPAAPSPVSALLSGVMIKTGVYGVMRYFLWLVPAESLSDFHSGAWGLVIALIGTVTLLLGTAKALGQEQTKRLLAYHSIGQIGYILLGFGICLSLVSNPAAGARQVALLGLFAALFHTINHGVFKSLLFLNAGSLLYVTDTQDLNKMGGLMRYMPVSGVTALVGACSISGIPLFNGFASKWGLYSAGFQAAPWSAYLPLCAAVAVFTSALTLASFVKFFGASFMSRAGRHVIESVSEGSRKVLDWKMKVAQVLPALVCVLLGIFPVVVFSRFHYALGRDAQGMLLSLTDGAPVEGGLWRGVEALGAKAVFAPIGLLVVLGALVLFCCWLLRAGGAQRRPASPWLCGYAWDAEDFRYNAHGYYGELKALFKCKGNTRLNRESDDMYALGSETDTAARGRAGVVAEKTETD
ncbi:MAG: peroxiredoxin family protein [Verrucomicrobia bacterium]|nr:peroxiredoxin family protein [Verrucomicrobiota bacterium]